MMDNLINDTMKGLFFIIKGHYCRGLSPAYINKVTGETGHLGGYNPYSEDTEEWYQVLDRKCFNTIYCGSDIHKALSSVQNTIVRFKGVARNYFREVSKTTSDDYYEVHYLGHRELTPEQRTKKCEGRCPRTSPVMADMYRNIDSLYGDYMCDEIGAAEESAYERLKSERPVNKSRRLLQRTRKSLGLENVVQTQEKKPVLKKTKEKEVSHQKLVNTRKRKSVKLLSV